MAQDPSSVVRCRLLAPPSRCLPGAAPSASASAQPDCMPTSPRSASLLRLVSTGPPSCASSRGSSRPLSTVCSGSPTPQCAARRPRPLTLSPVPGGHWSRPPRPPLISGQPRRTHSPAQTDPLATLDAPAAHRAVVDVPEVDPVQLVRARSGVLRRGHGWNASSGSAVASSAASRTGSHTFPGC